MIAWLPRRCARARLVAVLLLMPGLPMLAGAEVERIRVGIYSNAPKVFLAPNGEPTGFWPDLTRVIAQREGWAIEWVHGTWEESLDRLGDNSIDVMVDVALTPQRRERFSFGNETVHVSWSQMYAAPGVRVETIPDLHGKRIGALAQSINLKGPEGLETLLEKFVVAATVITMPDYDAIFAALEKGEIDAGVTNREFGNRMQSEFDVVRTPILFQPVDLRYAFSVDGPFTEEIRRRFDERIAALRRDPTSRYYELQSAWLGARQNGPLQTGECAEQAAEVAHGLRDVLEGRRKVFVIEYPCHSPEHYRWFRVMVNRLVPGGDRAEQHGAVVMHVDITERKLAEQELNRLAYQDPLTDLPSRNGFTVQLTQWVQQTGWQPALLVMMLDIIGLRDINDAHGYEIGDQLLVSLGGRLREQVGELGLAGRTGGDEFVLLLTPVAGHDPEHRLAAVAAALRERFIVAGVELEIGIRIGYTRLGEWILRDACRQLREWRDAGRQIVQVSINVSLVQLMSGDFPHLVQAALDDFALAPDALSLEITESVFERESASLLAQLVELHDMGVRLSLDDFGTGYSSLLYLQKYPFDEIKIDQGFVRHIRDDVYSREIVSMVMGLARAFSAEVVAEGIESIQVRDTLLALGCRIGQGYYYSVPLEAQALGRLLDGKTCLLLREGDG